MTHQIDGVYMGSPLASVLANLFMGHHEMKWLDTFSSEILFYRRCVGDTFCLFHSESDVSLCRPVGWFLPGWDIFRFKRTFNVDSVRQN